MYTLGIVFYALCVRVAALFSQKARLMVHGWRDTFARLALPQALPRDRERVWFHVSSLGEFEQARPVLERYRELHPDHFVLLTFFSPSGYEVRKDYSGADMVCYLPMDTPRNARRLVSTIQPSMVFFVKYDFWFNTMRELKRRDIPLYIFSAIFRPKQYFFGWYGGWFLRQLNCFTHIFVQNDESLQLLNSHGIKHCSIAGDTRFDRVAQIAAAAQPSAIAERFVAAHGTGARVIVAGSTWPPDEQLLASYFKLRQSAPLDNKLLLIIAPHVVDESHLRQIEQLFAAPDVKTVRYSLLQSSEGDAWDTTPPNGVFESDKQRELAISAMTEHCLAEQNGAFESDEQREPAISAMTEHCLAEQNVLIIDNYGLLSSLYRYADVVYIGGGFGHGIHNILEAITFGKPVCFGPNYHKFQEARNIIELGGGTSIKDAESLTRQFDLWLTDTEVYNKASQTCRHYVESNKGGCDKISRIFSLAFVLSSFLALATSCSVNKFVSPNDKLLYSNHYSIEMPDGNKPPEEVDNVLKSLKSYAAQSPNKKFLGVRWGMRLYCLSSPTDTNWFHNYLRHNNQHPVVYNENATRRTASQLQSLMVTKGCFSSTVDYDTSMRGRNVTVTYHLHPSPRYLVNDINYTIPQPEILKLVKEQAKESYLHIGDYYDQDLIAKERDRIVQNLLEAGYYRANPSMVSFLLDTTYTPGRIDIEIAVNKNAVDTAGYLHKYRIKDIFVLQGGSRNDMVFDTSYYESAFRGRTTRYAILSAPDTLHRHQVSPKVICRNLMLFSGQLYHPNNRSRTYNSLLALRNFKYIDIDFVESTTPADTVPTVDARVRLLTSPRQKLSASLELNNSSTFGTQGSDAAAMIGSGNFGLETVLEYQNRNLFGGAELLKVDASLLVELPKLILSQGATKFHDAFTAFESGLNISLDLPQFLLPFTQNILFQRMRPHTVLGIGANYQYRSYFERMLANMSFGYSWSSTSHTRHQLLPIELTFVKFIDKDEAFVSRLESISDLRLKYQYSDHFIMDCRYDFLYSSQIPNRRINFNYLHITLETAGNLLQNLSILSNGPTDENGIRQFFGVPYSQYMRVNADMKRYFYLSERNTFVTRLLLGVGLPYANSLSMPYEKSFFGGGPTTMRAWQLRHLGPGLYSNGDNPMAERVGDMTLVLNLEDRFHIASIFEGALFADIGNVWLTHESSEFEGGKFEPDKLLSSLAVGAGLGLRLKVSIITLRLDFAIPVYDPGYEPTHRWRPPYWKFSQIVTNLGIDYPF